MPNLQTLLAAGALAILGALGVGCLIVPVPAANATIFATIIGALAGALTLAGGQKVADRMNNPGASAAVQPDAAIPQKQESSP